MGHRLITSKKSYLAGIATLFVAFVLFCAPEAWAQNDRRRTTIDFEDELIQGEVKKPELLYLLQKKQFNFKRLIKLREHFKPEMRRTAEELQQTGSNN